MYCLQDLERLTSLLYGDDTDLVDFSELLHCCLGQMNERRHLLVRKVGPCYFHTLFLFDVSGLHLSYFF